MQSTSDARSAKLDNLQILRALAALSVVVAHAFHETRAIANTGGGEAAGRLAFGVDIFFVLSGFIMAHTSAGEFGQPGASLRFFTRRCARVIPLYWLLTSALLLGSAAAPSLLNVPVGGVGHIVDSYLFIPDLRAPGEVRPVMALGWTLNYEMLFYVIFSIALLTPIRYAMVWLSAQMAVMALGHLIVDPSHVAASFWTDPIILEFLFGVYVALMFRAGWRVGGGVAAAMFTLGLAGFVPLGGLDQLAPFLRNGVPAALLVAAAALGPAASASRLVLGAVALGDASYSLYLVHPFVLRPARLVWMKTVGAHLPAVLFAPCAVAACIAVGFFVYRRAERPLTGYAQGLLRRRREPASVRAPVGL